MDVSVDTIRTRLRQGKIYPVEKIQQSLNNFFRKGNLSALRELALRQVALDQAAKSHDYRLREGLEHAAIPEKVMVAMASRGSAKRLLRMGSRIAARLASDWVAVYVAHVVKLKGQNVADHLIEFARQHDITHVVFGQSARSRWDVLLHGSVINRFLSEVRDATVQLVPLEDDSLATDVSAPNGRRSANSKFRPRLFTFNWPVLRTEIRPEVLTMCPPTNETCAERACLVIFCRLPTQELLSNESRNREAREIRFMSSSQA